MIEIFNKKLKLTKSGKCNIIRLFDNKAIKTWVKIMKAYTAKEIRSLFLKYFEKNGHTIVQSSPLIPRDDATLLFANSGMVQFKKIFQGDEVREYSRATTAQKSLRVSGKHNDLENVGRTARHHTFFEMLGNFSFGDYFKKDAINFAWNFITEELKLPKERLYVTVYEEDDEAEELWQSEAKIDKSRIFRIGAKDNFWSMGDTGPCGPCSEIFIDQGEDMKCGDNCGIGQCDCDRYLEIWNLVFMQYNQSPEGRESLPKPSIDTGMGLERVAAVCQGKRSNFDCDLFQDIIQYSAKLANVQYSFSEPDTNDIDTALRVIADHSRSVAFLIADGVLPGNEGRSYVLRRLLRRALRFATLMGVDEPILYKVVRKVSEIMGEEYPELPHSIDFISRVVKEEEERFAKTLNQGLQRLDEEMEKLAKEGKNAISGQVAFTFYDTYGFPVDIVDDIARKKNFTVDIEDYEKCMLEQKTRSRSAQKGKGLLGGQSSDMADIFKKYVEDGAHTEFVGYETLVAKSRITVLLDEDGLPTEKLELGEKGYLLASQTPFYGESGGQTGDTGVISSPEGVLAVVDTQKPLANCYVHIVEVLSGTVYADQEIELEVADEVRVASARNHTATHILHAALRTVLGTHVQQKGSLVEKDRLRFDFTHISAMTAEELEKVENEVNRLILQNESIETKEMAHKEAVEFGAMALFGEKYGEKVRVVNIGNKDSVELCGGTHLNMTGQIGSFIILSESGIAAGIRRIEAATGYNALQIIQEERKDLTSIAQNLKTKPQEALTKVQALQAEIKALKKDLEKAKVSSNSSASGKDIMASKEDINGISLIVKHTDGLSVKILRELMDDVKSKLPSGIACLSTVADDKPQIIVYVSKDLHSKVTAPDLIKEISTYINGSGGGRPDQAQAGGTDASGLDKAIEALKAKIKNI